MEKITAYVPTERRVTVGTKTITVRSLRPVFKDAEERDRAAQNVQAGLYRVFYKYAGKDVS